MSKNNKGQSNNIKNKELEEKKTFRVAFAYALVFVLVLIVFGVTGTYAYYNVTTTGSISATSVSSSTPCFSVTLSDSGAYSLKYNYPITDTFATNGNNITPMTITVKNSCTSGDAIPYKLYLTTYPDSGNTSAMDNARVKMQVTRSLAGATAAAISGFDKVTVKSKTAETTVTDALKNSVGAKASDLKTGKYILIDSNTVAANKSNTYNFKFWIDYGTTSETQIKGTFKAVASAVIN